MTDLDDDLDNEERRVRAAEQADHPAGRASRRLTPDERIEIRDERQQPEWPRLTPVPNPDTGEPLPLEVAGFIALRGQAFNAASALEQLPVETFDRLITFAERAERRAKLTGAGQHEQDQIAADVAVLRAARKFRLELKQIGERAAARERLAPGPRPAS